MPSHHPTGSTRVLIPAACAILLGEDGRFFEPSNWWSATHPHSLEHDLWLDPLEILKGCGRPLGLIFSFDASRKHDTLDAGNPPSEQGGDIEMVPVILPPETSHHPKFQNESVHIAKVEAVSHHLVEESADIFRRRQVPSGPMYKKLLPTGWPLLHLHLRQALLPQSSTSWALDLRSGVCQRGLEYAILYGGFPTNGPTRVYFEFERTLFGGTSPATRTRSLL